MPLYTQIRGGRAMASERGSRNVIISKTVDVTVYNIYTCACVWVKQATTFSFVVDVRILYY